jgi:hypothetical protein
MAWIPSSSPVVFYGLYDGCDKLRVLTHNDAKASKVYDDRFVGAKETELGKWKSEQTDEEFIPMHQIVWDRRGKVDLVFGSGIGEGV